MEKKLSCEVSRFVRVLKQHLPILAERYKVKYLGMFGSYIRFERYLSELLGVKVDLVMKDALKPAIGKHILKEVVQV